MKKKIKKRGDNIRHPFLQSNMTNILKAINTK